MAAATWSGHRGFVVVAAGAAVGLGNVWRFPYLVHRYGGGAFLLAYLASLLSLGLPLLMAEILIGRRGRSTPAGSLEIVARAEGRTCWWRWIGWVGPGAAVLVLSAYSVMAGSLAAHLVGTSLGKLAGADPARVAGPLADQPWPMIGYHCLFVGLITLVTARSIRAGLERIQSLLLSALLVVLLGLLLYVARTTGRFADGLGLLLRPDFSLLNWRGVLEAMRHAIMTLALGLGVMMSYGAALPSGTSIPGAALVVVALDTIVTLLAAMVVFLLLLAGGSSPAEGSALAYTAIPGAAAVIPGGPIAAVAFFCFLTLAAVSSGIGILYPVVDQLESRRGMRRGPAALLAGGTVWLLGFLSMVDWPATRTWLGHRAILDVLGFLGSTILLPLSVLGVALFAGWAMSRGATRTELRLARPRLFVIWRHSMRYLVPPALLAILVLGILERVWR